MLNIGMMELLVLLLVAFVIVGPKDLPKVARFLGKAIRYLTGLVKDVTAALDLEEEVETVKEAASTVKDVKTKTESALNPRNILSPIEKELYGVQKEVKTAATSTERLFSSVEKEIPVAKPPAEKVDNSEVIPAQTTKPTEENTA